MTARLKALVWILRPAKYGGAEVLLLERPGQRGGGLHPVTGKADGDETPAQCAAREAEEETGLRGALHDLERRHVFRDQRRGRAMEEHAFLLVVPAGSEPKLSSEHIAARWAEPADARAALTWPAHREALDRALGLFAQLSASC